MRPSSTLACLLASALALRVSGRQILVGGTDGWTRTRLYEPINAEINDELVFQWTPGQHNVVELQGTDSCEGVANAAPLFDITAPQPAVVQLDSAGSRTFACGLPSHCSDGMRLTVNVREPGTAAETPQEDLEQDLRHALRPGVGRCDEATYDEATDLFKRTCYSPEITLAPGQIEDAIYLLLSPFPNKTVGAVHHESNILEAGTGRLVPLSEVYLHHVFAAGDFVVGEGAEHAGSKFHAPLQAPYHTVIPAGKFDSDRSRLVNIHIINTLGVPPEHILPCIECWCAEGATTRAGKLGGGACCNSTQCVSTEPATTLRTYVMEYSVWYRVLEPGQPLSPVHSFMMDNAGGFIEFDVKRPEAEPEDASTWTTLTKTGPIDSRCPQTQPLRMINCVGHLHIGGEQMRLFNSDTGEVYCQSNGTYGTGPRDEIGNEDGYLVAMSMHSRNEPVVIPAGTNVTMQAIYRPENHYGVMALMFLGLVDFDRSCPASTGAAPPGYEGWTAFGPDFSNQRGSAFGFYEGELATTGSGDVAATEKVEAEETSAEPAEPAEESAQPAEAAEDPAKEDGALTGAHNGKLLTGAVFVAIVLGVALVAGIVLVRRRRSLNYSKLHTETDQLRRGTTSQLSEP